MTTRKQVEILTDQGFSVRQIAERIGVVRNTVEYHQRQIAAGKPAGTKGVVDVEIRGVVRTVSTRDAVRKLLSEGVSRAEIARRLCITKPTVSYHARRLGEPIDERVNRRYDWEKVQSFYDAGRSARACCRYFGMSTKTWHDAKARGAIKPRPRKMTVTELLSKPRGRDHLKLRLLTEGLLKPLCADCGIDAWRGEPLSLQLHHVNGKGHDNRLENLQLLCPNCHSQTENWGGRNKTKPPLVEPADPKVALRRPGTAR